MDWSPRLEDQWDLSSGKGTAMGMGSEESPNASFTLLVILQGFGEPIHAENGVWTRLGLHAPCQLTIHPDECYTWWRARPWEVLPCGLATAG